LEAFYRKGGGGESRKQKAGVAWWRRAGEMGRGTVTCGSPCPNFVALNCWGDAMHEAGVFLRRSGRVIIPLTVREILEEEIARKLA
jgi:hypothetical protein